MFVTKLTIFSLLVCFTSLYSIDNQAGIFSRSLGSFGQSKAVCWYNKYLFLPFRKRIRSVLGWKLNNSLAEDDCQSLAKESQKKIGMSEKRILPVKKIDERSPLAKIVTAIAEPDAIYVNQEKLKQLSFGRQRISLLHEATHIKYNDAAVQQLIGLGISICAIGVGFSLAHYLALDGSLKIACHIGSASVASIIAWLASKKLSRFMERRADVEGHVAAGCAMCVKESAYRTHQLIEENNPLVKNGYLSPVELDKIVTYFEERELYCLHHKKSS